MYGRKQNLYDILELPRNANATEIALAYKKLTEQLQLETTPPAAGRGTLLHEAHEVLSHPVRRAAYDKSLMEPNVVILPGGAAVRPRWAGLAAGGLAVFAAAFLYFSPRSGPSPASPAKEGGPKTPHEIRADASFSVGPIHALDPSGRQVRAGIATAIAEGVMVTPCHGLAPGAQLVVNVASRAIPARVSMADEELDLCRLAVEGVGSRPLVISDATLRPGDTVYTALFNTEGQIGLAQARVERILSDPRGKLVVATSPAFTVENGQPLLDRNGKLLGIAVAPHAFGNGVVAALPATWIPAARARSVRR